MLVKCKNCGKEFEKKTGLQMFCCEDCRRSYEKFSKAIRAKISKLASEHGFDVKNKEKIVRAKEMIFGRENLKFCPCDAKNPNRYCGSALCISDIVYKGKCHCSLFHAKKTLQEYENGL